MKRGPALRRRSPRTRASAGIERPSRVGRWRTVTLTYQGLDRSCFQRPPSEPCMRFSLTRLATEPSPPRDRPGRCPAGVAGGQGLGPTPTTAPAEDASPAAYACDPRAGSAHSCGPAAQPRRGPAWRTPACSARADNTDTSRSDTAAGPPAARSSGRAVGRADPATGAPAPGTVAGPSVPANVIPPMLPVADLAARPADGGSPRSRTLPD